MYIYVCTVYMYACMRVCMNECMYVYIKLKNRKRTGISYADKVHHLNTNKE